MQIKNRNLIVLWLIVIIFSGVACNFLAGRAAATPTPVPTPIPPASSLEERADESREQFETQGTFEFTITESELTTLAAEELARQSDPLLSDPQVLLREGQITILGNVYQSGFSVPAEIILGPKISANGDLQVEVLSMRVGPFAVPDQLRDEVSRIANDLVASQLADSGNVQVEQITIEEGVLTVSGSRR
jgi:hypothetical protein